MRFNPLTDEQIDELPDDALTDGFANCFIKEAKEAISQSSGKPMISMILNAEGEHGGEGIIYLHLVLQGKKFSMQRLKSFMRAVGEEKQYMSGEIIASRLVAKSFQALIKQKKDSQYFEIEEFIVPAQQAGTPVPLVNLSYPSAVKAEDDDDVPF